MTSQTTSSLDYILVLLVAATILCHDVIRVLAVDLSQANCRKTLGMQTGAILDEFITASSSYDEASVGPSNGRIRTERNGGAWCPKQQISRNVYEWIEVDLQDLKVITQVETQGRFGNGQGQEYAESYMLEYQRTDSGRWIRFHDRKANEVFPGNSNTYIAELREINPPIIAHKIRIVPHSNHQRTICMRIELYGCQWRDGVLSYSMPQGERRGTEVDLYDFTYDGTVIDEYLTDGLGQLTDGAEGHSNFRLDPDGWGKKGYEWVGWKNDTVDRLPVEIIFEFEKVRNFSAVRFHCNNMFSKEVRVFRKAVLHFGIAGDDAYQDRPIVYEYMRDTLIEFARNVIVNVPHRIAKFIKVELYFDSKWMMISEVRFESDIAAGNYTDDVLPPGYTTSSHREQRLIPNNASGGDVTESRPNDVALLDDQLVGIIVGALSAVVLVLVAIIIFCLICRRCKKFENNNGVISTQKVALNFRSTMAPHDLHAVGTPTRKVSNGNTYSNVVTCDTDTTQDNTLNNRKSLSNGDVYKQSQDVIQTRRLPDVPRIPVESADYLSDTNTSTYAVPDMSHISPGSTTSPPYIPAPPAIPANIPSEYGPTDTSLYHHAPYSGGLYCDNDQPQWLNDDVTLMEFPRESLKFVEKLGQGLFGEVHLCEALRIQDIIGDDFLLNRMGSRPMLVAVKVLSNDVTNKTRDDFYREIKMMSRIKDPNIVCMLGVCTKEDPLCVIIEYMKYGDLNQFLQLHVASESSLARNLQVKTLSYGCLIYMATQIASGMKFLETLNMVHRDLATRNCLVGHQYTIKISDFGMSRSLYSADYYRIDGKAVLPIRWMAWESVLLGKFSTKSDVWSFAVTLWEILTFAREQPFDGLTDEQVIENCGHYYHDDQLQISLTQPNNSPKEIFDLMIECWNHDETQRPAFREIHMFLQRKNMGYNPTDERQAPSRNNSQYV